MPEFSRKDLNSRKLELEYLNIVMIISEQTFGCLNCGSLWLSECLDVGIIDRWFEPLFLCLCLNFDRTVSWFSIPAKIDWIGWIGYFHFEILNDDLNRYSCKILFELWMLTWTDIPAKIVWVVIHAKLFDRSMNWFSIPTYIVWIMNVDSNWYFPFDQWLEPLFPQNLFDLWLLTWTAISLQLFEFWSIDELIQYSRENCLIWLLTWTVIFIWTMTWTVIPERTFEFSSMIWTVDRMFEFWSMTWTIIPERAFEFWSMNWTVIPAKLLTWTVISMQMFEFWSMNWFSIPAKLVDLNQYYRATVCGKNLNRELHVTVLLYFRFIFRCSIWTSCFVTVDSPRMCFHINFVAVFVLILNLPCICTINFVAEFKNFRRLRSLR